MLLAPLLYQLQVFFVVHIHCYILRFGFCDTWISKRIIFYSRYTCILLLSLCKHGVDLNYYCVMLLSISFYIVYNDTISSISSVMQ